MFALLSKWRYEAIAIAVALITCAVHFIAREPPSGRAIASSSLSGILTRAVQSLEGRADDFKFRLRGEMPAHPDVLILAADEKAAQRYGLWPWPRDVVAKGFDQLLEAGAKAIALDICFTDPTAASQASTELLGKLDGIENLPEALEPLRAELREKASHSPDDALEAVFKKGGKRIIQGSIPYTEADLKDFSIDLQDEQSRLLEPNLIRKVPFKAGIFKELNTDRINAWQQYSVQTPLPRFASAGNRLGHFTAITEPDGSIRRAAVLAKLTGPKALYPSIALLAAAQMLDATIEPVIVDEDLVEVKLRKPDGTTVSVPMEGLSALELIDYPGNGKRSFTTLSFADVIDGTFDKDKVKDKAVLVGVTITGLTGDQRVTPFSEMEPGVYTHAAVLSNILSQRFMTRTVNVVLVEMLMMLVLAILFSVAIPRFKSFTMKGLLIVAVLAGWWGVAMFQFNRGVNVSLVMPSIDILLSSFAVVFLGYLSVDREKLKMRTTFARYLGDDVMEVALVDPERLNRGEKREMTVMFSDIRGFTTLSERMSAEVLSTFINEYLSPMTDIVFEEKGTLDKYIGDAVMAFWNAPLDQPDHALRACRAAVKMLEKLEDLKAGWRAKGYPELEIGIGINSGPMVVGNMGSDVRVDYTVLGDSVNLGSRLEGTNKEYDTRIIISESTWSMAKDEIISRRLGAVRVKGKKVPVGIYELRGIGSPKGDEATAIASFEAGIQAYVHRNWDEAERLFKVVMNIWKDDYPATSYLEDIATFRQEPPPPDWDGVVTMKTK